MVRNSKIELPPASSWKVWIKHFGWMDHQVLL